MMERAHRIVLWCVFGPPPLTLRRARPLAVHMCGNPKCLNPEHLVWGDTAANQQRDPDDSAMLVYAKLLEEQGRTTSSPPQTEQQQKQKTKVVRHPKAGPAAGPSNSARNPTTKA